MGSRSSSSSTTHNHYTTNTENYALQGDNTGNAVLGSNNTMISTDHGAIDSAYDFVDGFASDAFGFAESSVNESLGLAGDVTNDALRFAESNVDGALGFASDALYESTQSNNAAREDALDFGRDALGMANDTFDSALDGITDTADSAMHHVSGFGETALGFAANAMNESLLASSMANQNAMNAIHDLSMAQAQSDTKTMENFHSVIKSAQTDGQSIVAETSEKMVKTVMLAGAAVAVVFGLSLMRKA